VVRVAVGDLDRRELGKRSAGELQEHEIERAAIGSSEVSYGKSSE